MLVLTGLGVGEVLGSNMVGAAVDRLTDRQAAWFCFSVIVASIMTVLAYIFNYQFSYLYGTVICFMWGVQDSATYTLLNCILGF